MSDSNLLIEPLPRGWKNHQFGDVCDRVKDSYQPVDDGGTPYVGLEHLVHGFPAFVGRGKESEVKSSKTAFKTGDILFGKLRPYLRKGAQADFDGVCSTDILAFRAKTTCESELRIWCDAQGWGWRRCGSRRLIHMWTPVDSCLPKCSCGS